MQWLHFMMLMVIFLPAVFLTAFTPYFTRRTESFGVTVSEEAYYSRPLQVMRRNFAALNITLQLVLLVICAWGTVSRSDLSAQGVWMGIYTVAMVITHFLTLCYFHFKMKKYKAEHLSDTMHTSKLILDTKFRDRKLALSNQWYLIHAAIILFTAIFTIVSYDKFPDKIVMQYDLAGNPSTVKDKSIGTVFMPVIMQAILTVMFLYINTIIHRSRQQVDTDNPEVSLKKNAVFRMRNSLFTFVTSIMFILLFNFIQITMIYPVNPDLTFIVVIAMVFVILAGVTVLYITTGQGGSRVNSPGQPSSVTTRNEDDNWKLGIFYYNPDDPSLFVEKRMGFGWTLNHARPAAWLLPIGLVGSIVLVILLVP
ncbi:DUF1648 domain-containing protein [Paenibacillus jiagnxiensis]|uniref:DUF1648 domain-containing protein n=1 Tax=Paenibacillus jiagnxiensis TaxID=3228926 RepID=UPI0033B0CE58